MDLDRAQTLWTLGRFPCEDLPELAAQMMVQGFESPAILELASFHRPQPTDVPTPLVQQAFQDCGRAPLAREDAIENRIAQLLRSEKPPPAVLSEIWQLLSGPYEYAFNEGPLSELARLAEDWDEAAEDPLMREALEDHLPPAGRRYLGYLGKSR